MNMQSKGDRSGPAKHPSMAKLALTRMKFQLFGSKVSKCSYPCFVQTGPLYKDPGGGYLPSNFPKIHGSQ